MCIPSSPRIIDLALFPYLNQCSSCCSSCSCPAVTLPQHRCQATVSFCGVTMELFSIFSGFMALVTISVAARTPSAAVQPPSFNPEDYKQYYLKTKLASGRKNIRSNNAYVQPYHTGAGLDDVVLTKNRSATNTAYKNGTFILFNFPEGNQPFYPRGTFMTTDVFYAVELAMLRRISCCGSRPRY